jgi:hypothetical protein
MEKFYLQNIERGFVGSSMLWWKQGDYGYTTNLEEAHVFSLAEIEEQGLDKSPYKYRIWPKNYIDFKAVKTVDFQYTDNNNAIN